MEEESSRFPSPHGSRWRAPSHQRRAWSVAAVLAIVVFGTGAGFAVAGCGGDDNNNSSGNVNSAIDSIQSQASSVQSQISSISTNVETQAQSVKTQVQSVQSQVSTATTNNGGYGY